jgi:hypothetical protein
VSANITLETEGGITINCLIDGKKIIPFDEIDSNNLTLTISVVAPVTDDINSFFGALLGWLLTK